MKTKAEKTRVFIQYITTDADYTLDDFDLTCNVKSDKRPKFCFMTRELLPEEVEAIEKNDIEAEWRVGVSW